MQYLSGANLAVGALEFLAESTTVTLFTAYLKVSELEKLNHEEKIKRIVVRWEIQDLCLGVSDLELYNYCRKKNISLYRNTRLHLKTFLNEKNSIFFGSANITNRGIGEIGNFNFELNSRIPEADFKTVKYLNQILVQSEYVDENLYQNIVNLVNQVQEPPPNYPELKTNKREEDYFLLSDLPMTRTVEDLYQAYNSVEDLTIEEKNCAAHDLALYQVPPGLNRGYFFAHIESSFNNHPFIKKLKEEIRMRGSIHYGGVVRWIQVNTTSVPTPRSWELKKDQIVNILYEWICYNNDNFKWHMPGGRSQVIFYTEKM